MSLLETLVEFGAGGGLATFVAGASWWISEARRSIPLRQTILGPRGASAVVWVWAARAGAVADGRLAVERGGFAAFWAARSSVALRVLPIAAPVDDPAAAGAAAAACSSSDCAGAAALAAARMSQRAVAVGSRTVPPQFNVGA